MRRDHEKPEEAEGDRLALGERDTDPEALGLMLTEELAEGEILALAEVLELGLIEGLAEGEILAEGDMLVDGLIEGLGLIDADSLDVSILNVLIKPSSSMPP